MRIRTHTWRNLEGRRRRTTEILLGWFWAGPHLQLILVS